ncbi:hypothetical protein BDW02DRAFT_282612 [Decorospora gaudefroyi]|uniref:Uncharacterized protein n=1 Tax=Decorospora gaudefroyi TaxID=184978 RepID=A0A6A5KMK8_9PLEO|nr:hypothetical protein BDW02DRAFT_282612 [Decorospora gaudefroyi]
MAWIINLGPNPPKGPVAPRDTASASPAHAHWLPVTGRRGIVRGERGFSHDPLPPHTTTLRLLRQWDTIRRETIALVGLVGRCTLHGRPVCSPEQERCRLRDHRFVRSLTHHTASCTGQGGAHTHCTRMMRTPPWKLAAAGIAVSGREPRAMLG